jgi:hypothetical protein
MFGRNRLFLSLTAEKKTKTMIMKRKRKKIGEICKNNHQHYLLSGAYRGWGPWSATPPPPASENLLGFTMERPPVLEILFK